LCALTEDINNITKKESKTRDEQECQACKDRIIARLRSQNVRLLSYLNRSGTNRKKFA